MLALETACVEAAVVETDDWFVVALEEVLKEG